MGKIGYRVNSSILLLATNKMNVRNNNVLLLRRSRCDHIFLHTTYYYYGIFLSKPTFKIQKT